MITQRELEDDVTYQMSYLAYIHKGHEDIARRYFVERAAIVQDVVLSGGLVLAIMCAESFAEELKINPPS